MSVYHLSVKAVSRASGRSAVAAAAYRAGDRLTNERDGLTHDYTRRHGVEHAELVVPANAPEWAADRAQLWNAAEAAEARKDAKVAREWEVSLPHELSAAEREALAVEYAHHLSDRYGIAVDVAIHAPSGQSDERNHHAHILGTTRELGPEGFGAKTRVLDSPKTSGQEVEACRETWADFCNRALERAGHEQRVDHRSLEAQHDEALAIANDNQRAEPERRDAQVLAEALDREPEPKIGVAATAMERRGIATERGDLARDVVGRNLERTSLRQQIREISDRVVAIGREIAGRVQEVVEEKTPDWIKQGLANARERLKSYQEIEAGKRRAAEEIERFKAERARQRTPEARYERSRAAFEKSARTIETLPSGKLVLDATQQQHFTAMKQALGAWVRVEPERAWKAASKFETDKPVVGPELKKELVLEVGKDRELMRRIGERSPALESEIRRRSIEIEIELERQRDRSIGWSF